MLTPDLAGLTQALRDLNLRDETIDAVIKELERGSQGYGEARLPSLPAGCVGGSAAGAEFARNAGVAEKLLNGYFDDSRQSMRGSSSSLEDFRQNVHRADEDAEATFTSRIGRYREQVGDAGEGSEG